jgi:hypothetical protein
MTFHYRVIPLEKESKTCLLSEHAFAEKEAPGSTTVKECALVSADTDYLCLERAAENFEAAWKAHQLELARAQSAHDGEAQPRSISSIRRANTSDTPDDASADSSLSERIILHPTSIGKLCPPEKNASEVNIVCSWSAIGSSQEEVIRGEHHKRGLSVRPISKCQGCPIAPTATYDHSVFHDFKQGPAVSALFADIGRCRPTIIISLSFCCLFSLLRIMCIYI